MLVYLVTKKSYNSVHEPLENMDNIAISSNFRIAKTANLFLKQKIFFVKLFLGKFFEWI